MAQHDTQTTRSKRGTPRNPSGTSQLIREGGVQLHLPVGSAFHLKAAFNDFLTEAGLLLIHAFINDEVEELAGKRYQHNDGLSARRHGEAEGSVVVGGQKIPIKRPRLRTEGKEVQLTSYQLFADESQMTEEVYKKMMLGISTRNYEETVHEFAGGYGVEKSSVSRHFQEASAKELAALVERPLSDLHINVIMIDGVHFAGEVFIVALGIDEKGIKHVLGLWSGATENSEVVGCLLDDMVARGLQSDYPYLFVVDGSQALSKAIRSRFGAQSSLQRCRVHKKKNILDHLPKQYHSGASMRLNAAWSCIDYDEAHQALTETHVFLEGINSHAARSLEEAFDELLTVQRLKVPAQLHPYLSNTNMIENLFSTVRHKTKNVKRWQDKPPKGKKTQDMRQRWVASSLIEAEKKFRRVRQYRYMADLAAILRNKKEATLSA